MVQLTDGERIETGKVLISFQTDHEQAARIQKFATSQKRSVSAAIRILIDRGLARSIVK